jgi:hypothetical protein
VGCLRLYSEGVTSLLKCVELSQKLFAQRASEFFLHCDKPCAKGFTFGFPFGSVFITLKGFQWSSEWFGVGSLCGMSTSRPSHCEAVPALEHSFLLGR